MSSFETSTTPYRGQLGITKNRQMAVFCCFGKQNYGVDLLTQYYLLTTKRSEWNESGGAIFIPERSAGRRNLRQQFLLPSVASEIHTP
jgi:hypothetical protein